MDKQTLKRYLISSLITFLSGFFAVFSVQLGAITPDTITTSAVAGILLTSFRAGIKILAEYLPTLINKK